MQQLSQDGRIRFLAGLFEGRVKRLKKLVDLAAPDDLIANEIELIRSANIQLVQLEHDRWDLSNDAYFGYVSPTRLSGRCQFTK
jgi:hypothetical protein